MLGRGIGGQRVEDNVNGFGCAMLVCPTFGEFALPAISMFYGIVIAMFFFDDEQHHTPHIHTRYQGMDASVSILDGTLLAGSIPANKLRLVQAWIEIHREELMADWDLATSGQELFKIDPLR